MPRTFRVLLAACMTALLALALAATASAQEPGTDETTTTAITSPGDPYFTLADDRGTYADVNGDDIDDRNAITITGTADGDEELAIVCFYGEYDDDWDYTNVANVAPDRFKGTADRRTFSVTVEKDDLVDDESQPCHLRAFPSEESFGEEIDSRAFAGPRVGVGYIDDDATQDERDRSTRGRAARGTTTRSLTGYEIGAPGLRGYYQHMAQSWCAVCWSTVLKPGNFAQPNEDGWSVASSTWTNGHYGYFRDRSMLMVDGHQVWDRWSTYDRGDLAGLEGKPGFSYALESHDPRTGNFTVREVQEYARCDTPGGKPLEPGSGLTAENCPRLVPAGVRLVRRVTQTAQGLVASYSDEWQSTDGKAHGLHVEYEFDAYGDRVWQLPGTTSYERYSNGQLDEVELPQEQVGSILGVDPQDAEYYGCGPFCSREGRDISTGDGPPVSVTYSSRPDRVLFDDEESFYALYDRLVPAGGAVRLSHTMGQELSEDAMEAQAAAVEDGITPASVAITSPGNGTTVGEPKVTVKGTAGQDTETLKVNGQAVAVTPDGTWSAEVGLGEGANTVTAVATDGAGHTAQDQRSVTYAKGAPVAQSAPNTGAGTGPAKGKGLKGLTFRSKRPRLKGRTFTVKFACVPGLPRNGTMRVKGKLRGKSRTLSTEVFQCPGGGTRTVEFEVRSSTYRRLMRKAKRLQITVFVVTTDQAGEPQSFRQKLTLLTSGR